MNKPSFAILACNALLISALPCSAQSSDIADDLAGFEPFNAQCLITQPQQQVDLSLCDSLMVFDLRQVAPAQRSAITRHHLGLGLTSPIVITTHPRVNGKEKTYVLDHYDRNFLYNQILPNIQPAPVRVRRSAAITQEYQQGKYVRSLHRRFSTGLGTSDLIYKLSMYAQSPITDGGSRRKYIDITLNQGAGIDFNTPNRAISSWHPDSFANQFKFYQMGQYLDSFDVTVSIDNASLKAGDAGLVDWSPKAYEQQDLSITQNKSFEFNFGLKNIPKSPIDSVGIKFEESITIQSSRSVSLQTQVDTQHYYLKYSNDRLGSDAGDAGWCTLIPDGSGCWYESDSYENPYDYTKLDEVYKSGFRPDFTSSFSGTDATKGISTISIRTNARGISLLGNSRNPAGNRYYAGNRVDGVPFWGYDHVDKFSIDVNWNHPVYLGAETVTLSPLALSAVDSQCLTVDPTNQLSFTPCAANNHSQAFIYSSNKQYHFAANPNLCLDSGSETLSLSKCEAFPSLSQKWQWKAGNEFDPDILYSHDDGQYLRVIDTSLTSPIKVKVIGRNQSVPTEHRFDSYDVKLF